MANLVQSGVASAERIFELLDAEEQEPDPPSGEAGRPDAAGQVALENVSFRYDPEKPLIEDLSLIGRAGQTVAIVGPTGAGKTTLVNLLMRFYEVTGGPHHPRRGRRARRCRATSCGPGSAWCSRTPGCSAARSRRTSRTAPRARSPGGDRGGGAGRARRPVHPDPARTATTRPDRRRGQRGQRGREAADHHRAGVPLRPGDPGARRGDELRRHPDRGADPEGDGAPRARAYAAS